MSVQLPLCLCDFANGPVRDHKKNSRIKYISIYGYSIVCVCVPGGWQFGGQWGNRWAQSETESEINAHLAGGKGAGANLFITKSRRGIKGLSWRHLGQIGC